MNSNAAFVAVLVVAVSLSGCGGLAGSGDENTSASTSAPITGTANGAATQPASSTRSTTISPTETTEPTATTVAPTSTKTETPTPTRTPSRATPPRTPTETKTPTETETPTPTTTSTSSATTPAPTATPARTPTTTSTGSIPSRPADLADDNDFFVVKAVGNGASYYRIYVPGSIQLGSAADTDAEAAHPERVISQRTTYLQGYVGNGGVDTFSTGVSTGVMINDGNATLQVYRNGTLFATLEPGAGLRNGSSIAPITLPPPNASETVVRVEAVGDGTAVYTLSATKELRLGTKADVAAEADHPDGPPVVDANGMRGYIGNGGVDTYRTAGTVDYLRNDGNTTLKVFTGDELWATVEPNESVGNQFSEA